MSWLDRLLFVSISPRGPQVSGFPAYLKWRQLVLVATLNALASSIPVFFIGALAIQVQGELGFGHREQGTVIATYFAFAAVSSRFLGGIADRIPVTIAVRLSLILALCSCAGIALLADSWLILCIFMASAGVGNGLINPALARILSKNIPLRRQGFSFGVRQTATSLAALLGGLAIPVVALTVGWRFSFVGAGVLCFILLILPDILIAPKAKGVPKITLLSTERLPRLGLHLITVAFGLGTAAATALTAFAMNSMVEIGIGISDAGLLLALGSLGAATMRVWGGWIIDRGRVDHLLLVIIVLVGAGVSLIALSAGVLWATTISIVLAYTFSWGWAGLMFFAVVDFHRNNPASATGKAQSGAALGSVLGPILMSLVIEALSYQAVWLFAAAISLVAAVLVMLVRKMASNDLEVGG